MAQRRNTPADFWRRVERPSNPDACWEWQGHRRGGRYGSISWGSKRAQRSTHRVAYELTYGPIPAGMFVMHKCDNPPCCRPDHLALGTPAENSADMVQKGRSVRGERNPRVLHPERYPIGSNHWKAKLTEAQVAEIRKVPLRRGVIAALARQYSVSWRTIDFIFRGDTWRHVAVPNAEVKQ